jgi:putative ABC transport system permease protein
MKPRWRKVFHDLLDNKARTLLVVFSIAVGVFSIGVIAGAYQIIGNDMSASYSANRPANVELRMADFDDDMLDLIHNQDGVEEAEGRRVFNIRVRVPGTEKWAHTGYDRVRGFRGKRDQPAGSHRRAGDAREA